MQHAERGLRLAEQFLDLRGADVRLRAEQVVEVMVVGFQTRVVRSPLLDRVLPDGEDLGVHERRRAEHLPHQPAGLPGHRRRLLVAEVGEVGHQRVHVKLAEAAHQPVERLEPLDQRAGPFAETALVRLDGGHVGCQRLERLLPRLRRLEHALGVPLVLGRDLAARADRALVTHKGESFRVYR